MARNAMKSIFIRMFSTELARKTREEAKSKEEASELRFIRTRRELSVKQADRLAYLESKGY